MVLVVGTVWEWMLRLSEIFQDRINYIVLSLMHQVQHQVQFLLVSLQVSLVASQQSYLAVFLLVIRLQGQAALRPVFQPIQPRFQVDFPLVGLLDFQVVSHRDNHHCSHLLCHLQYQRPHRPYRLACLPPLLHNRRQCQQVQVVSQVMNRQDNLLVNHLLNLHHQLDSLQVSHLRSRPASLHINRQVNHLGSRPSSLLQNHQLHRRPARPVSHRVSHQATLLVNQQHNPLIRHPVFLLVSPVDFLRNSPQLYLLQYHQVIPVPNQVDNRH
jgi:hypothetical protein